MEERPWVQSVWGWEHYSKYGKLLDAWKRPNICTIQGLTHMLNDVFSKGTQKQNWFVSIFNDDYTPLAGATYQVPGYTEDTNYSGPRPTWQEGGVSSLVITNSSNRAEFLFTGPTTIYGGSLVSGSIQGDVAASEILFSVSRFGAAKNFAVGEVLKVTVSITASDKG